MRKKILILLGFVFLTSGCTINYDLSIMDGNYTEKIDSIETNSTYFETNDEGVIPANELKKFYLKQPIPLSESTPMLDDGMGTENDAAYYHVEDISNDSRVGLRFNGYFRSVDLAESRMIDYGYNRFLKATVNDNVILSTGEKLKIFEEYSNLDSVVIKIKTNHKVIKENADKINKNTYIWNVDRNNYSDKSIYFEFEAEGPKEGELGSSIWIWLLIIIVFLVVAIFIGLRIYKKHKKSNKI